MMVAQRAVMKEGVDHPCLLFVRQGKANAGFIQVRLKVVC